MKLATLFALTVCGAASAASLPEHVVVVSIDGLRPVEYTQAANGLNIPVMRDMVRAGCASPGVTGVFPSVTYPSHTAIVTGRYPSEHGIDSNTPLDPFDRTNQGWFFYAEQIKVPTLWDAARKAGRKTAAVYWPVTVGAPIDYLVPEFREVRSEDDLAVLRTMGTPGLLREIEERYGRLRADHLDDRQLAEAAAYILTKYRPNLLMLHLPMVDHFEHVNGPGSPEANAAIERADANLAFLRKAAADAGMAEKTAWVILSDHGFRAISRQFNPLAVLRGLGYVTYDSTGNLTDWRVFPRIAGGSFALYARDSKDTEAIERSTRLFTYLASDSGFGLAKLFSPQDLAAMHAFPGAFLAADAAPGFAFGGSTSGALVGPAGSKGTHGYDPRNAELKASLIFSGAGVRHCDSLPDASLVDIAPTLAALLGVPMPETAGKPLAIQ